MKYLIAALFALPLLAACNTISGAGKDVAAAGNAVSKAADEVKEEIED